jgi:hypothetical protein
MDRQSKRAPSFGVKGRTLSSVCGSGAAFIFSKDTFAGVSVDLPGLVWDGL